MYTAFFGLKQDPFSISPDPRYLFMSERHGEALAHLLYGVQGAGGIVLLTGDIGTGKTTISRRFLEQAPADCQVAYIFNPRLNVIELLRSIGDEFGVTLPEDGREPTVKALLVPAQRFPAGRPRRGPPTRCWSSTRRKTSRPKCWSSCGCSRIWKPARKNCCRSC